MDKIILKHLHIYVTLIISLGLFNAGCSQFHFKKFIFGKKDKTNTLEEKVDTLSNSITNLVAINDGLKRKLNDLNQEKESLNKEYTLLKNKQSAIETTQKLLDTEHKNLQEELIRTKNMLQEISKKLKIVELDKNDIKTQLEQLTLYSKSTNVGKGTDTGENRKSLAKETQTKQATSDIEDLLDKAIQLYRQGKFEEAIAKWEKVLELDPSKLEAKFNIEIARDRIKESEIQKELKSSLIQRK